MKVLARPQCQCPWLEQDVLFYLDSCAMAGSSLLLPIARGRRCKGCFIVGYFYLLFKASVSVCTEGGRGACVRACACVCVGGWVCGCDREGGG